MTTLVLNEAELSVELNRLMRSVLDTRRKLLSFSLRAGTQAVAYIARNSALALTRAVQELSDLVHRLGGRPTLEANMQDLQLVAPIAEEEDLLDACEHAVAEVACQYRDALEWSMPDPAQEVLMRQFGAVIANYEAIRDMQQHLRALLTYRVRSSRATQIDAIG
ncbi:MAG TPA: hypothetical protein VFB54_10490 [Burkholderiales bacterium]|nr:hypothetical protein [Burkholderiales bacterium]